jgi:hypothetical protein
MRVEGSDFQSGSPVCAAKDVVGREYLSANDDRPQVFTLEIAMKPREKQRISHESVACKFLHGGALAAHH